MAIYYFLQVGELLNFGMVGSPIEFFLFGDFPFRIERIGLGAQRSRIIGFAEYFPFRIHR